LGAKKPSGVLHLLTFETLIGFFEQLTSYGECAGQIGFLEVFFQEHFSASVYIWLKTPHKSNASNTKHINLPFDPITFSENQSSGLAKAHTLEIEEVYWAVFPLSQRDEDFGKLILSRNIPFTDQEISVLEQYSAVAGLAIFSTLQVQLQHWQQKQLKLVRSVTMRVSQITDLTRLTQELSRLIQETFNYYYVAVFLIQDDSGRLHFKASAGSDESKRPEFEQDEHPGFALGEHIIGYVAQTGLELVANDVTKEPRYHFVDSLVATQAEVVIPLKVENRIFGVLDIQSDVKNAFDHEDLLVLRVLADNIAIAIEGVRLYQYAQKRADQLAIVADVSRAVTHLLDIDELLQKTVTLIHDRFKIPYVHLYTIDPVHQQISFKAGSGDRTKFYQKAEISFNINSEMGVLSWVAQHGQTLRVDDVNQEPLFLPAPILPSIEGSEMVVPLSFGDQLLGLLDLQSDETNAFSDEDQQLMETLGDNLAVAIRNARLYHSEQWRRQVAESLKDVAGLLSNNIALSDVLMAILENLHNNLPCDVSGIWLFKDNHVSVNTLESQDLYLAAYKTSPTFSNDALAHLTFKPGEWTKAVLTQKEPEVRKINDPIGPIAALLNLPRDHSAITAPLTIGDEVIGMLTMIHHTSGRYGPESQKITAAFASYAAIATQNNRLYARSQEQARVSMILLQVANAIQSLTDLDELTATIVRITPMVVGVKGCALILRSAESNIFQLSAMYGITDSEGDHHEEPLILLSPPILERLLVDQAPIYVTDPQKDLNLPENIANQFVRNTLILFPLTARHEIIGAFLLATDPVLSQKEQPSDIFDEERYKIVQGIMQQTAIAIDNIRLFEARQEEAYISAVLLQTAQAIVSSADLQDTLDSMVNIMPILIGIESSLIYLWDEKGGYFSTAHAIIPSSVDTHALLKLTFEPGDFPMLDTIFHHNRPIVHPFIETVLQPEDWDLALPDEDQVDPTPILQTHYPLLMGFPLSIKGQVFGVLLAQDDSFATNRERRFELLRGIAQQASLAIQNDRLNKEMLDRHRLEREFQLAREIQQTFLPNQIPELSGWEMDVRWETARQVGGDFYDFFILPDGRLAFLIADVSDKGLAASLYMAVTRTILRTVALEFDSPATILEHVNDLLLENSQNGLFVTIFYGILDLNTGYLTYTNAGHNPPVVIRPQSNDVITLRKGGIALGALPDIHLPLYETTLKNGDCLILYTDGVTEAFNLQDQMYGEERFLQVLQGLMGTSTSKVLETLEKDLENFRDGAPLSDDTTLLAIRNTKLLSNENGDMRSA
jgi:serine phosphatase RsbU (regulator of sigma subunit)/putative methionine-R-sulfoxide reductase with GAF domain